MGGHMYMYFGDMLLPLQLYLLKPLTQQEWVMHTVPSFQGWTPGNSGDSFSPSQLAVLRSPRIPDLVQHVNPKA
jgi:hypothetical protein